MNSKEVYQVQVVQHLAEWLATLDNKDPEESWCTEHATATWAVEKFNKWLEGRLFGYDDKR